MNGGDLQRGLAQVDRILLFPNAAYGRDRGLIAYQQGNWSQTRKQYVKQMSTAPAADTVRQLLDRMDDA